MIYRSPLLRLKELTAGNGKTAKDWGLGEGRPSGERAAVYYSGLARQALLDGLDLLGIDRGDKVLVPAYICREAIAPFILKGITPGYYGINKDFSADTAGLERAFDKKTRALLYVNYFGLASDSGGYRSFCRSHNIFLIEDNAHTLPSASCSTAADVSFFSLRKFYPVVNGALLVVKNEKIAGSCANRRDFVENRWTIPDYEFLAATLLRRIYSLSSNPATNYLLWKYKDRDRARRVWGYENRQRLEPCALSEKITRLSLELINKMRPEEIVERRRENYNFLLDRIRAIENGPVHIVFSRIDKDSCPLAFPVRVQGHREYFIKRLFLKGFISYPWPDLPAEIIGNKDYENENYLYSSMVLLPIHQGLGRKKLEKMAEVIKKTTAEIDGKN